MSRLITKRAKYEAPRDIRFPLSRRGELLHENERFPCLIQDISLGGIFGICARDLVAGQKLNVKFELDPGHLHQCSIQIQHVAHGCFGAKIVNVGEIEHKVFLQYIDQCFKEMKRR